MSIDTDYNAWADQYDTNDNKTRDLDRKATRMVLAGLHFETVIELGCGTGKNTAWLLTNAKKVIALDFSEGMLAKAREKIDSDKVEFRLTDLNKPWDVSDSLADLVTCNLVLEHIENLDFIFEQAQRKLRTGGRFFISELHPFKQYLGTKARFETEIGIQELEVYVHHISDFTNAAEKNGFRLVKLKEWFDEDNQPGIPRLITFLFTKK